nr:hypothetical protein Iba_chr11eCG12740 [Ipomoea batatas]
MNEPLFSSSLAENEEEEEASFFLTNLWAFSSSLKNLKVGGGEGLVENSKSVVDSKKGLMRGVRGGVKYGGEAIGVKNGVSRTSLRLLVLDPFLLLDFPSSDDSKSSFVSSLIVNRNLGGPESLNSSTSMLSSPWGLCT